MDLNALADLPLTYPEVGATATGRLPAGYNHLDVSTQIGTGRQRFEQAADAVMHWGMQRNAGLRVRASSETAVVSAVVLVGIAFLRAPCRVVYVIDEPDVRGFGYGTLPGHPVSGEERFAVRCDPMTSVVFAEVLSFSPTGPRVADEGIAAVSTAAAATAIPSEGRNRPGRPGGTAVSAGPAVTVE